MDPSFTREEKRFVLAEMLKSSNICVETLWQFVKANQIIPVWIDMQVPLGRTLSQCIQVVQQMAEAPPRRESPSTSRSGEVCRRQQPQLTPESRNPRNKGLPSSTLAQLAIRPRPPAAHDQNLVVSASSPAPAAHSQPRKRGRPSRADRAKSLIPNLPPHLDPRSRSNPGYRPILPAAALPPNSSSLRPSPSLTHPPQILPESPHVQRENKRRRVEDTAQMQQPVSTALDANNAAPAVSSGAI
ncbi:uncharacterized protein CPUR_00487 [Claviceps purpurea 20.1]|uniref:Uncharacterized protein n=1 Tax=Claviceps purpurea (strain 20.1) TaxID=1111077 RepID=M1W1S5_CLAP2|nr:hypothetical protein E4U38_005461 [Claviceps purpurea]KAG6220755.1 hypothetical protein E4U34_002669 [Claviceps purpurea]KAG6231358.1 hypothetical protein E4U26_006957 [Claviceps purpurea]KAG6242638.1 hypothetical protein E4U23_006784 [Claviceps purpurea]CCE27015.1 uncharacterized protein CPUR_00487 [Claviceps purpurea 20.1]